MATIPQSTQEDFERASERFNKAFDRLPADKKSRVEKLIEAAHRETLRALGKSPAVSEHDAAPIIHELALAGTARRGQTLEELLTPEAEAEADAEFTPYISPEGQIWWIEKYQQLDPLWLESVAVWLENYNNKVKPFPTAPATVQIPDSTTIALVGDWGGGNYGDSTPPCLQVATAIRSLNPDYAIHLGDVYYSGTADEEQTKFLQYWAPGSKGSFALNSNHEMMDGGHGYFGTLLTNELFQQQNGTSYFALENSHWVLVGLDSSYYSDYWKMYGPGNLDSENQLPFLQAQAAAAQQAGKNLLVMTHQNGLAGDASSTETLWNQVLAQLPGGSQTYWYWGHQHIGVVYVPQNNIVPRCSGYGAIPWGAAPALQNSKISWFESQQSPDVSYEVMNGFTLLTFNGAQLTEQFIDQTGQVRWTSS